jgi:hypothetical protein
LDADPCRRHHRAETALARDAKYEFTNSNRGQGLEREVRIDGAAMARPWRSRPIVTPFRNVEHHGAQV